MAGFSQNMEKHKEEKYKQNIRHGTYETVYGGECGLVFLSHSLPMALALT